MQRESYFMDWSDFPSIVDKFIEEYVDPSLERRTYRLVPMRDVIKFIVKEYGCGYDSARNKLIILCNRRRDLKLITLRNPNRDAFAPKPVITRYVQVKKVRKRFHR